MNFRYKISISSLLIILYGAAWGASTDDDATVTINLPMYTDFNLLKPTATQNCLSGYKKYNWQNTTSSQQVSVVSSRPSGTDQPQTLPVTVTHNPPNAEGCYGYFSLSSSGLTRSGEYKYFFTLQAQNQNNQTINLRSTIDFTTVFLFLGNNYSGQLSDCKLTNNQDGYKCTIKVRHLDF